MLPSSTAEREEYACKQLCPVAHDMLRTPIMRHQCYVPAADLMLLFINVYQLTSTCSRRSGTKRGRPSRLVRGRDHTDVAEMSYIVRGITIGGRHRCLLLDITWHDFHNL